MWRRRAGASTGAVERGAKVTARAGVCGQAHSLRYRSPSKYPTPVQVYGRDNRGPVTAAGLCDPTYKDP